jgi:hypothetical protein
VCGAFHGNVKDALWTEAPRQWQMRPGASLNRGQTMCACDVPGVFATPPSALIANLDVTLTTVAVAGQSLPMTINDGRRTCYLCCPSAAWLDYAADELRHFNASPVLKRALRGLIGAARPLVASSGLDRQVQPNNWLVATNILPDVDAGEIARVTKGLTDQWPRHALVWRSFNSICHGELMARFFACGYVALPTRRIYLFDARGTPPPFHRDERRDYALLMKGDYEVIGPDEIRPEDFDRIAWLYQRLYLDKYTWLNPQYTPLFMQRAHTDRLLRFHGLRGSDGTLDGVIGLFERDGTITAPVVGYNTAKPAEDGLYRRLMAIAMTRARDQRGLYNMSAGAGSFKRHRGGVPALEYNMVYTRHLNSVRRLAGACVAGLLKTVGVRVLEGFDL